MLKNFTFCSFIFASFISGIAKSGDTTHITTHDKVVIKTNPSAGFTTYSGWGIFPAGGVQYRKVYLYLEFGCAPGLKCGEWDYLNHIYLNRKGGVKGDSLNYELARFITPYGNYWTAAGKWKHGWYFDLTDFSTLLHDSLQIVYKHTGYEANHDRGWTVTMQFHCIEGTPDLQPLDVTRFFEVSAPFGSAGSAFKDAVPDKTFTVKSGADMVRLKVIQTGHGMDQQENCAEFCNKERTIRIDNNVVNKANVWRDNCGMNSLYPQAGTWPYDRAGWCPGAPVIPADVDVKLQENTPHTFSMDMESYLNSTGGSANYYITAYAIHFKDNRKQRDASLDDVISPSSHPDHLRYNPECGAPILSVKNSGMDTIKTIYVEYGRMDGVIQWVEAHCNIPPLQTHPVPLESIYNWSGTNNVFYAKILKVNNQPDENIENNIIYSTITNTSVFHDKIVIILTTNSAASENYYCITDSRNKVFTNKGNFTNNKTYRDTVSLFTNVCYKFEFFDDGPAANNWMNEDGLGFFGSPNDGNGSLIIRSAYDNRLMKSFNADFGTKIIHNFYTTYSMGVDDLGTDNQPAITIGVYPNPSSLVTNFSVDFIKTEAAKISIYDASGKLVHERLSNGYSEIFNMEHLTAGIYSVVVMQGNSKQTRRFIVQ